MNTIGTFRQDGENFIGNVNTLAFSGSVTIEPIREKRGENSPDFQVFARSNRAQVGAARKKLSEAGKDYLSMRLDDPSFPAPIFCRLVRFEGEEGHRLIWSRS